MLNDSGEYNLNDLIEANDSGTVEYSIPVHSNQGITERVRSLVASANAETTEVRRVPLATALRVAGRSLERTVYDLANPERRAFTALREVSDFIRVYTTGDGPKIAPHFDLLPVGHPLSSQIADEATTLTASASWLANDPNIPTQARGLVESALNSEEGSLERIYAVGYLSEIQGDSKPVQVISNLSN